MTTNKSCYTCCKPCKMTESIVECKLCENVIHLNCTTFSNEVYVKNKSVELQYYCQLCMNDIIPFSSVTNENLIRLLKFSEPKLTNQHDLINNVENDFYCLPGTLNDDCQNNIGFKLLHANVRSLVKNIDKVELLIHQINIMPDIIGITETKLKSHIQHKPYITGYDFINKNSLTNAGGVGFFIKSNLSFKIVNTYDLKLPDCEDLWIEVFINKTKKITIAVIYRHPNSNLNDFKCKMEQAVEMLNQNNSSYVLCGDYNINLLKHNNFVNDYTDTLLSLGCDQHIHIPTRTSYNNTSTLLDHIYSNLSKEQISCKVILNDISDHKPILAQINYKIDNREKHTIIKHDIKNLDNNKFVEDLQTEMNLIYIKNFENVNDLTDYFLSVYTKTVEKHAPSKKITSKEYKLKHKPWITPEILKSIRIKNKLFKRYIRLKTQSSREIYKRFRNKLTHTLDISKKAYFSKQFSCSKRDPKTLWKNVEKIIRFKKSKSNSINLINNQGDLIKDPKSIANAFNNYFVNIGSNLSNSLPNDCPTFDPGELINNNIDSMFLKPITHIEMSEYIANLDANKSSPSSCSPIKLIKIAAEVLIPVLTYIFNRCLIEGIFPSSFKIAEVIPIFKSGSKLSISNHRPISLLSPFSKLLEKCIFNRLNDFFNSYNLLYKFQFGFRNNSSTENAVLQIYNELLSKINKKEISCSIFIDLKKAFDTVNHSILIKKLNKYGVRGICSKLFESYLSERKQYTLVNGYKSNCSNINCGVPQGSTLGPLLFLIYINDFYLASNFTLNLFADDAYLTMSDYSPQVLQTKVNKELEKINTWLTSNKLTVNLNKTTYLIITNKKYSFKFEIKMGNKIINQNTEANYLGTIIDQKLNWKPHINFIKNKLASGCWALYKLKNLLNTDALKIVYFGLIYQRLQYCLSCWGGVAPTNLQKLIVLQKRAVRLINKASPRTHTSPIFKTLNLLKLEDVYKFQIAKIMYRINQGNWHGSHDLIKLDSVHSHFTRSSNSSNFYMGSPTMSRNSLIKIGPKIWMKVPAELKSLSFHLFKQRLRSYFISSY